MQAIRRRKRINWVPYVLIAPFFIGYVLFSLYPTLYAFRLSFFSWDAMSPMKFVGLKNYLNIIGNRYFNQALLVSLQYVLTGPVASLLALTVAVVISGQLVRAKNFYRLSFFVPYMTMPVAIGVLFSMLLGWDLGIINRVCVALGIYQTPINWLGERSLVFFCVCLVVVWRYFGYHMIIYMGGMKSIDSALYEAAKIDGADSWQSFWRITMPLMKPYIVYLMITSISGGMNMFDEPMMLYTVTGGPGGMAQNVGMMIYQQVFVSNRWGYGSAMSFVSFAIIAVMTLVFYRINYRNGMGG